MTAPTIVGGCTARQHEAGLFNAYAVTSRSGPHVTMQAGVLHAGRFWTTTSARSLKSRSVSAHSYASAVVPSGSSVRVVAGRTTALHPFRPLDLTADPTAPFRAAGAVLRLGVDQVEQLLGYLESAGRIPSGWLPHKRVMLITKLDRSLTLEGDDVVEANGAWAHAGAMTAIEPSGDAVSHEDLPHQQLPAKHREAVRLDARTHVGVSTPNGPVALPARWLGEDRFAVSAPALVAVDAMFPAPAVAVFDDSTSRRPDEKVGAMFRGSAVVERLDGNRATLALHTEKITTWDGFEADTVAIDR